MKNIFLSASIPLPGRHPKYYDTADIIGIRDAVIALAGLVLGKHKIIWGGHPSITPLINYVIERIIQNRIDTNYVETLNSEDQNAVVFKKLKKEISEHVIIYQSLFFKDKFPEDNDRFENIVFTNDTGDEASSLQLMRTEMLFGKDFAAAVFIGGMKGIEVEYNMFKEQYSDALIIPIASTGAATKIVYDNLLSEDEAKNERFLKDYGYTSMLQKYLIDKI